MAVPRIARCVRRVRAASRPACVLLAFLAVWAPRAAAGEGLDCGAVQDILKDHGQVWTDMRPLSLVVRTAGSKLVGIYPSRHLLAAGRSGPIREGQSDHEACAVLGGGALHLYFEETGLAILGIPEPVGLPPAVCERLGAGRALSLGPGEYEGVPVKAGVVFEIETTLTRPPA